MNIALRALLAKFPIEQIQRTVHEHILPLTCSLPDQRLKRVAERIILGILGGQTPVITEIARQSSKAEGETWSVAKSIYRRQPRGAGRGARGLSRPGLSGFGQGLDSRGPDDLAGRCDGGDA